MKMTTYTRICASKGCSSVMNNRIGMYCKGCCCN